MMVYLYINITHLTSRLIDIVSILVVAKVFLSISRITPLKIAGPFLRYYSMF